MRHFSRSLLVLVAAAAAVAVAATGATSARITRSIDADNRLRRAHDEDRQRRTRGRRIDMKKLIASALVATLFAFAAAASAQFTPETLPANHHIHDCTAAPCAYPHLAVGFFPTILGESRATYLQDPAECNDATDKALLPPNETSGTPRQNQPLRAGVCYTSTTLIHMRSIDASGPAPDGWAGPIAPVPRSRPGAVAGRRRRKTCNQQPASHSRPTACRGRAPRPTCAPRPRHPWGSRRVRCRCPTGPNRRPARCR